MASVDTELQAELQTIKDKIIDGTYALKKNDIKNCSGKHWNIFRCVINEGGQKVINTYACSMVNCFKVIRSNLKIEGTGKLRRHYEQCNRSERIGVDSFFDKEYVPPAAKKIKTFHKTAVNDAAVSFVVNDMRPVEAVTKAGLVTLLTVFTQIGAAYGKMNPADVLQILPSRFSVSNISLFILR